MKNESLLSIWIEAKQIIEPLCDGLPVLTDEPGDWRVETPSGRPFITLRIQKSHVGLYLLPMYYHPHIRPRSMDAYLKGKSTFRFVRTKPLPVEGIQDIIERARAMIGAY